MGLLTRDQILATAEPSVDVEVPEWGGTVRVRAISAAARDRLGAWLAEQKAAGKGLAGLRARIIVLCVIGDDGQPLFTEADLPTVDARSDRAIDRIVGVAEKLNGLTEAAIAAAAKNSDAGQSGASPSASPATSDSPSASS